MSAETPDIETMKRADLPVIWDEYRAQAQKLITTAETLTITSVTQVAEMKLARQTRLALKGVRVEIENKRKELGEFHLRETQKINGAAKELKELIEPLETRLLEQEQFAERAEAARKAELKTIREADLLPFGVNTTFYNLADMPDEDYAQLFEASKVAHEAKIEAARKAEAERIAKEKAETKERERIRLENIRLKEEAAEREAAVAKEREEAARKSREEKEKADAEVARVKAEAEKARIAAEKKAAKERADAEARAKTERERAQKNEMALQEIRGIQQQVAISVIGRAGVRKGGTVECLEETLEETKRWVIDDHFGVFQHAAQEAKENAVAEIEAALAEKRIVVARDAEAKTLREASEAKARQEHEARVKAEKELKDKRDAEEEQRRDAEAASKKAARAPDKTKLVAFADALIEVECATLASNEAGEILDAAFKAIEALAKEIKTKAAAL